MNHLERIKALREDSDTPQKEIAAFIGVAQSYYSKQERGDKPFRVDQIAQIALFYHVSADYILGLPRGLDWPR